MTIKCNIKKIILLVLLLIFTLLKYTSAYDFSFQDPSIQYNQSGQPYISFGENPSGDYNDLNVLGEGLTYDVSEALDNGNYKVDVWHNSSQIADGDILSINVTINFTTNSSSYFSLQIYDFTNLQWVNCNSDSVLAGIQNIWWCNETSSPMNYNSSDRIIRIRINSTDTSLGVLKEDYVQYYVGYQTGYLEVNITNPDITLSTNVIQNYTFPVNATITCRNGPCNEVTGIIRYNLTSPNPDTSVNVSSGDKPFYIQEIPVNALKSCGIMYKDQICQLSWTINATGDIGTSWKIDVLFNSSYPEFQENQTSNAEISIISCIMDFSLSWSSIKFGLLNPSTGPNEAPGNTKNEYNITVNDGSCNSDLYIKGTDLVNETLNSVIGVGNVTWGNASDNYLTSFSLTKSDEVIELNVPKKTNITTWYWINVPAVYAGYYTGAITVTGVKNV